MLKATVLIVDSNLKPDEFNMLSTLVTADKRKRINNFKFYEDAQRTLLGDILARVEICSVTGQKNHQLNFTAGDFGKPHLANNPHINYNISHSGSYIACAVSSRPVGIDVESASNVDIEIANRFFAPDEIEYIFSPSNKSKHERFYQIWTMKESHTKWEGSGLSKPLTSFSVLLPYEETQLYYSLVYKNAEAICYLCTTLQEKPHIKTITISELLDFISIL